MSDNVSVTCDKCDELITESEDAIDAAIQKCDECDRNLCADCLAGMYREQGVKESDVNQIAILYGASGFMNKVEGGDDWLCPECYADKD